MALTIQNSTYAQVGAADSPVTLTCKDNNGNTFPRTTIEVNTQIGDVQIDLPYIPSLADDLLTEIVIIFGEDSNNVKISANTPAPTPSLPFPVTQQIGSASDITLASGSGEGQIVILRPVSEGIWAFVQTA